MNRYSATAGEFRISLEAGVIDRDEIIRWADGIIASEPYDHDIANICMAGNATDKELESLLAIVSGGEEPWDGVRRMLGRMHDALLRDPGRLHEFTRFLERICIRNHYDLPEDLRFMMGLEDDFLLAEEGQWGSVQQVEMRLIDDLVRFRNGSEDVSDAI